MTTALLQRIEDDAVVSGGPCLRCGEHTTGRFLVGTWSVLPIGRRTPKTEVGYMRMCPKHVEEV